MTLTNQQPIRHICLLMAMQQEAQPVIDALELKLVNKLNPKLPMQCYQNTIDKLAVSLVVAGQDSRHHVDYIGSEAATLMSYEAISQLSPDLLISAGTAGGFAKHGAQIGTVYISQQHFIYHDRHVPLPGFDLSSVGHYPAAKIEKLARTLKITPGVISTGSSLEKNERDFKLLEQYDVRAKEMEAAAIAWVAMLLEVPVFAIKSITNLLDQRNQSEQEFVKNLAHASTCLQTKLVELVEYLQGKSLADLSEQS